MKSPEKIEGTNDLKPGIRLKMKSPKNLKLRTKLIGGFLFLALMAGIVSFVALRLALAEITADGIPTLATTGQVISLIKTIQAETLEFVASGEEEGLTQFDAGINNLNAISGQLEDLADELKELGVLVEDTKDGVRWQILDNDTEGRKKSDV